MKSWITLLVLIFSFAASTHAWATEYHPSLLKRGGLSIGASYGYGKYRVMNSDGAKAGYSLTLYQADLDMRIWDFGGADLRLIGTHQFGRGRGSKQSGDRIDTSETTAGFKMLLGSSLFFSLGFGQGQTRLTSAEFNQKIAASYKLHRAGVGLEFKINPKNYIGLELSYRNGAIGKIENSQFKENSYIEGAALALRWVWAPQFLDLFGATD